VYRLYTSRSTPLPVMCGDGAVMYKIWNIGYKAFEGYTRLTNPLDSNYALHKLKARNHNYWANPPNNDCTHVMHTAMIF